MKSRSRDGLAAKGLLRGGTEHGEHNFNLQYAIILFTSVHRQTEERKYWVNNRNISIAGERGLQGSIDLQVIVTPFVT